VHLLGIKHTIMFHFVLAKKTVSHTGQQLQVAAASTVAKSAVENLPTARSNYGSSSSVV
jgi:hypothetical protein